MEFPYGKIVTDIPKEFAPPEMWPEYNRLNDPASIGQREGVEGYPAAIRWGIWPFYFEEYVGDNEPEIQKLKTGRLTYNRVAVWKRIHHTDVPRGWCKGSSTPYRVDGFQTLTNDNLTNRWNKHARHDLRLWQASVLQHTYGIEEISFNEYSEAYEKSMVAKRLGKDRLHQLGRKLSSPLAQENTVLWGVRNLHTKNIVAGTAVIFSPTFKNSTHFSPFVCEEGKGIFAATGLIHHWFLEAKKRNTTYATTTTFWYPGKPKSWKGFSEFKSHFGFQYVTYPPVLWRLVRGKLF